MSKTPSYTDMKGRVAHYRLVAKARIVRCRPAELERQSAALTERFARAFADRGGSDSVALALGAGGYSWVDWDGDLPEKPAGYKLGDAVWISDSSASFN